MAILEFYAKLSPWKGLDNCAGELDYFLVNSHKYNDNSLYHLSIPYVKSYFYFLDFLAPLCNKRGPNRNRRPPVAASAGASGS